MPVKVQESICGLEARITALASTVRRLEVTVPQLTERLQQDMYSSS
jgi:hypothetical protein